MSAGGWRGSRRVLATSLTLLVVGASLSSCSEVEQAAGGGYQPARLDPVEGTDVKRVTFTEEAVERTGLRTATVRRSGRHLVVPYAAVIYNGRGRSFVYTRQAPRTFLRRAVAIDRIDRDRVLLSRGPSPGSAVVSVGATQVYGTELEIAGGH